jgi:GR25 family glycosyltransferase involved in LPS biosynthesis
MAKAGLNAVRTEGKYPHEYSRSDGKLQAQWRRSAGAIGCQYGQMRIMEDAFKSGKDAIVFEDDVLLCSDFRKRMDYIQEFLNRQEHWDIFWLGSLHF